MDTHKSQWAVAMDWCAARGLSPADPWVWRQATRAAKRELSVARKIVANLGRRYRLWRRLAHGRLTPDVIEARNAFEISRRILYYGVD